VTFTSTIGPWNRPTREERRASPPPLRGSRGHVPALGPEAAAAAVVVAIVVVVLAAPAAAAVVVVVVVVVVVLAAAVEHRVVVLGFAVTVDLARGEQTIVDIGVTLYVVLLVLLLDRPSPAACFGKRGEWGGGGGGGD
jgi:hypothetical protein